jgi:hypothetical protein
MIEYILTAALGFSGVAHVLQYIVAHRLRRLLKPAPLVRIGDTILSTDALLKLDDASLEAIVDEYATAKRRLNMLESAGNSELIARAAGKVH